MKELLTALIYSYMGTPYKWGGKSAVSGLDCSGFISELLKAFGLIPHKSDMNAAQLYALFPWVEEPQFGDLALFGASMSSIDHIGIYIDGGVYAEAGGGDHTTLTAADAAAKGACVRQRAVKYRGDLICYVRPPWPWLAA